MAPNIQSKGIGTYLMMSAVKYFAQRCTMTMGTMARTNFAQLKVLLNTRKLSGQIFQGEMAVYIVNPKDVPKIAVPSNATISCIDSEQKVEDLWEEVYGKQGCRLRTYTADFLDSPLHGGHFVISDNQGSAAGLSIWNPDFGVTVDTDGSKHKRTIFYNTWTKGPHGNDLLCALYSQKMQESPFRFAIVTVWRVNPAPPEKRREHIFPEVPTFSSVPIEALISPHSLGIEEEMAVLSLSKFYKDGKTLPNATQPSFFWDPRDCSTLLSFHEPFKSFDF